MKFLKQTDYPEYLIKKPLFPFYGWSSAASRLQIHCEETAYFL